MGRGARWVKGKLIKPKPCPNPLCRGGRIPIGPQTKVRGWERKPRKLAVSKQCPVCKGTGEVFDK